MYVGAIAGVLLAAATIGCQAQKVKCETVPGGCDKGNAYREALDGAIALFASDKHYGGRANTFASHLEGNTLAQISYTCAGGSVSPVVSGSELRTLLQKIASCPNQCGSVALSATQGGPECGLGVLMVHGAKDEGCFSKAINISPSSTASKTKSKPHKPLPTVISTTTPEPQSSTSRKVQTAVTTSHVTSSEGSMTASYAAPVSPTVVSGLGNFVSDGCLSSSGSGAVLVAGSKAFPRMTVKECIDYAAESAWQYAGLQDGRTCLVGSSLHNTSAALTQQKDCAVACAGDAAQACGGSSTFQLYRDIIFKDPTSEELAVAIQQYNATLVDARKAVIKFQQSLQKWQEYLTKSAQPQRRELALRALVSTRTQILEDIRSASSEVRAAGANVVRARSPVYRLFLIGGSRDVMRQGQPPVDETEMQALRHSLDQAERAMAQVQARAEAIDTSISQTPAESTASLLSVEQDLQVASASTAVIGTPAVVGPGVNAAGTGVLLTLGLLYAGFHSTSAGDGAAPAAEPTRVTTSMTSITTSTTSSTTTSSCQPSVTPRSIVVLMARDSTKEIFDKIMSGLESQHVTITDKFDHANVRAFTANLDDCQAQKLWTNPSVSTVSLNIGGTQDAASEVKAPNHGRRHVLPPMPNLNNTLHEFDRRVDSPLWVAQGSDDGAKYPFHLGWLTAAWNQRARSGEFLSYEDYLFDPADNPTQEPRKSMTNKRTVAVYILDTGAHAFHNEIHNNIDVSYDARQRHLAANALTDEDGHGTCMASCVGGLYAGVYKGVKIVPIKIARKGNDQPSVNDLIWAQALVLGDVQSLPRPAYGVMSMSIGYPLDKLLVSPGQERGKVDPFADLLDRARTANVVAVCSGGNDENAELSMHTPRRNGGSQTAMIVVGAANRDSSRWARTTFRDRTGAQILSIYANGVDVLCAAPYDDGTYQLQSGSSPATAIVAGLVALHIARGETDAQGAKSFIIRKATEQKGLWAQDGPGSGQGPHGPPRAALDRLISCTPKDPSHVPAATTPSLSLETPRLVTDLRVSQGPINALPEPPCVTLTAPAATP